MSEQTANAAGRAAGKKHLIYGALWAIGGTVAIVATYSAASAGGKHVIAWGAIVFGVIEFLCGLHLLDRSNRQ
jgi:hypothetical protein